MKPADHGKLDYSPIEKLAIESLLASDEPGIRLQMRRDLLGEGPSRMPTLNALRVLRAAGG
jgi:hypothetical protein